MCILSLFSKYLRGIMTKRLLPLIAGILLLLNCAPAQARTVDDIAAVVNNSVITMTDVRDRTNLYLSGQQVPAAARRQMEQKVLNKLIDEKLELQEAQKLGISVDEKQVNAGFGFIAHQNHLSPDAFRNHLQTDGVNINTLYAQIKAEIAWDQVVQRRIKPQINVSESDIDMTMKQITTHKTKREFHIAEIMLKVPNDAAKAQVLSKAEELVQKIKQGANFEAVAQKYSNGAAAQSGGDLGWVEEGQLAHRLDLALRALSNGQISNPIYANGGYHILFLLDTRGIVGGDFDASSPVVELKQIVIPFKKDDPQEVIQAKLARGIGLDHEVKGCATMDAQMKNFPYKGTGDLGSGPQDALPEPVRDIVAQLPVGKLSKPIRTPDGWALLMVCSRHKQTAAAQTGPDGIPGNLSLDDKKERQDIADKLGMQRLNQMAAHYLSDLRAAAFIQKKI